VAFLFGFVLVFAAPACPAVFSILLLLVCLLLLRLLAAVLFAAASFFSCFTFLLAFRLSCWKLRILTSLSRFLSAQKNGH